MDHEKMAISAWVQVYSFGASRREIQKTVKLCSAMHHEVMISEHIYFEEFEFLSELDLQEYYLTSLAAARWLSDIVEWEISGNRSDTVLLWLKELRKKISAHPAEASEVKKTLGSSNSLNELVGNSNWWNK